jgi:hypothetical protein
LTEGTQKAELFSWQFEKREGSMISKSRPRQVLARLFFFTASVIGCQALMAVPASSTTIPGFGGTIFAEVQAPNLDDQNSIAVGVGFTQVTAPTTGSDPTLGVGSATAQSFTGPPGLNMLAGGGTTADGITVSGSAHGTLTYFFQVQGAAGANNSVSVGINFAMVTSLIGTGVSNANASMHIIPFGFLSDGTNSQTNCNLQCSIIGTIHLMLTPLGVYEVDLGAGALGIGSNSTVSALIDPFIFSDNPNYSIIVSDGIQNVPLPGSGATPLPAALPLFASGAGLLGFFGWRRKQKASGSA